MVLCPWLSIGTATAKLQWQAWGRTAEFFYCLDDAKVAIAYRRQFCNTARPDEAADYQINERRNMMSIRISFATTILAIVAVAAAQAQPVKPDTSHIPFLLPKDIKWQVDPNFGEEFAYLVGDAAKPGLYVMLIRWKPGQMSTPHFHNTARYVYVVSGTWWVSSSDRFAPNTRYPLPAGSFATDLPGKVHWDGAKDETTILELVGMGPATTTKVTAKK
jgi:quercetin dioxygenase-like cupin family protein